MDEPAPGGRANAGEMRHARPRALAALRQRAASLEAAKAALEAQLAEHRAILARLDRQLRDSEERMRLAQRHAGVGFWDCDLGTGALSWSPECFALHGLQPDRVVPSRAAWVDAIAPEDRAGVEAALQDCLDRSSPDYRVEYRIRPPKAASAGWPHAAKWSAIRGASRSGWLA
ncbi:PAS domain-containing protein [Dankookia sp. P2]|uniref:PAS domain-containing protein n=1 Tax=Dankookia sp. P2 TaxID=3423955 RepID=UPI003D67FCD1